ncbi:MAG: diacylglycerol kinase family protein [Bacteroidota bacterium]
MPKEPFAVNRIKSVGYAFKGLFVLLKTESSIKIQFAIAVIMTAVGFYFDISNTEWALQFICIGMVMGIEGVNTAVEKLADFVQPGFNEKIGWIKDVSAGAVMAASLISVIVGCLIYIPKVF